MKLKWLEENRGLKLIALLAAIILWLYVGAQENPLDKHTYYVNLSVENIDADKAATLPQQTVSVTVLGRRDRLNAISAADFSAYVDLSDVESGENEVDVEVNLPNEVYLTEVSPRQLKVLVTQREGRTMDLDIIRSGTLSSGIEIVDMHMDTQSVFVSGDAQALRQVARVGVEVNLSEILSDTSVDAEVVCYDYLGNPITAADLTTSPASVKLSIKVNETKITKEVPIQANLTGSLPDGVQLDSVVVSPETIEVSGTPKELASISEIQTEPIDISTITETTTITVGLDSKKVDKKQMVTVTLNAAASTTNTQASTSSFVKVVPIVITGSAASEVTSDTAFVDVTYHMEEGYKDAGEELAAFVSVAEVPSEATTAQVQFASIEGLVIDSVTPSTITIYSAN